MSTVTLSSDCALQEPVTPMLFQVWIDEDCGRMPEPCWWWNSPPQPLRHALQEAADARAEGWIVCVLPEGQNPRPDGRWDDPC